jgi:hypothetical protein
MANKSEQLRPPEKGYQPAPATKPLGGYRPDQTDKPRGPPPNVGSGAQKPTK